MESRGFNIQEKPEPNTDNALVNMVRKVQQHNGPSHKALSKYQQRVQHAAALTRPATLNKNASSHNLYIGWIVWYFQQYKEQIRHRGKNKPRARPASTCWRADNV